MLELSAMWQLATVFDLIQCLKELCFDAGEQLCVLLGFRTTDDNCVDTLEADSERSQVSSL